MGLWDIFNLVTGVGGSLVDAGRARQAEEERKAEKQDAGQRIDDWTRYLMNGDGSYRGLAAIRDDYNKQWGDLTNRVSDQAWSTAAGIQSGYAGLQNQYSSLENALNQAYGDRTNTAMGMVADYGKQAKQDITDRYKALDNEQHARLISTGLGNTIMGASMQSGNQVRQDAEQRRLAEDVARVKLGTYGQFSGDQLATRRELGEGGIQLGQSGIRDVADANQWALGMSSGAAQNAMQAQQANEQSILAALQGQTDRRTSLLMDYPNPDPSPSFLTMANQAMMPYWMQEQENARNRKMANAQSQAAWNPMNMFGFGLTGKF
ncbi:MAG: hypothetical protein FWC56_05255 [Phycisphaerae bacterium]|nr:hypothetical protein [Phycisphaerae bacterium]